MKKFVYGILVLSLWVTTSVMALRFPLPSAGNDLFGEVKVASVQPNDTFATIARRFDVGYYELVEANPEVDPDHPMQGTVLVIPTQFLLPRVKREGIVVNLSSMRMYYFPKDANYFYTYPIGIGRQDWQTPLGELKIIQKIVNPVWYVPESVFRYREQQGDPVPKVVGPGPDNPLGKLALRLSKPTYLIHDTNDPGSVGRRSSAGCIHLYTEDIQQLFSMVHRGTRVFILNQPYIAGWDQDKLYIEAHYPLEEERPHLINNTTAVMDFINAVLPGHEESAVDWQKANDIVQEHTGIPTMIGTAKTPAAVPLAQPNAVGLAQHAGADSGQ